MTAGGIALPYAFAPWTIVLPLIGACGVLLAPRRAGAAVGTGAVLATLAASVGVAWGVWSGGGVRYPVGGWEAPLGIAFVVDGLSAVLLLTAGLIVSCVAVYATGYFAGAGPAGAWRQRDGFWSVTLLLLAGINLLFLSGDAFNLYVALEVMTIAAVALIVLEDEAAAVVAGMRYLVAALLGSMAYLLGVALLYARFHTLDLELLGARLEPGLPAWAAIALITVGLALKTALFPLHFWLPRAHASAPAPASALLSALVITASFYLLLRLWFGAFSAALSVPAAQLLGGLGGGAVIWAALQAIRQQRLKLMIAYSTVSQVGYLSLVFPLATAVAPPVALEAWSGGVYLAVSHALAKAAMFLAAGSIARGLGHDRVEGLRGTAHHQPLSVYAFGIAGVSLIGLPPTGGFVGKWLMLSAALETGQWWWAVVILVGGVLTAGYVFLVLGNALSQAEPGLEPTFRRTPRAMDYASLALAVVAVLIGLRAVELLELLTASAPSTSVTP